MVQVIRSYKSGECFQVCRHEEEASNEMLTMENISQEETNSEEECAEFCVSELDTNQETNQQLSEEDENEEKQEIKNSLTTNTTQTPTIGVTTLPFTSNLIANEPTNDLGQLEVAIGNFVRKELKILTNQ
ncbi:unnamed protein product [Ceratitis capitata]|uniref:(Mediterranean fruit fly) hypothetical protein n=1 Tax=Ceratitis capitata TaxID=7213 RepID=A0A811VG78_CERCA|nr:unnamed protein product [Ceratitis capitata]